MISWAVPLPVTVLGVGAHDPVMVIVCGNPPLILSREAAMGWVVGICRYDAVTPAQVPELQDVPLPPDVNSYPEGRSRVKLQEGVMLMLCDVPSPVIVLGDGEQPDIAIDCSLPPYVESNVAAIG